MKTLKNALLSTVLLSGSVLADNTSVIEKETLNETFKGIKCVRKIIEQRRGGLESLKNASEFTSRLRRSDSITNTKNITSDCYDYISESDKDKSISDGEMAQALLDDQSINYFNREFLKGFIEKDFECTKGGIGGSMALVVGLSVKLDGAYCRSTTGRVWGQISPGAGIGLGLTMQVDINGGTYTEEASENMTNSPIGVRDSNKKVMAGLFLGGSVEHKDGAEVTTEGIFPVLYPSLRDKGDRESDGLNIGLGGAGYKQGQVDLRLLPLGNDKEYLYTKLMR